MSYRSAWDPQSQGVRWRLAAGQTHTTLQIVNLIIIVIVMDPRWSLASQLCCSVIFYNWTVCIYIWILQPAHRHSDPFLILYWQNIILDELRKLSLVTTDHSMLTCPHCSVQCGLAARVALICTVWWTCHVSRVRARVNSVTIIRHQSIWTIYNSLYTLTLWLARWGAGGQFIVYISGLLSSHAIHSPGV